MNQIQTLKEFLDGNFRFYNVKQEKEARSKAASVQNVNEIQLLRKYIYGDLL